jgi:hypothetical protein
MRKQLATLVILGSVCGVLGDHAMLAQQTFTTFGAGGLPATRIGRSLRPRI